MQPAQERRSTTCEVALAVSMELSKGNRDPGLHDGGREKRVVKTAPGVWIEQLARHGARPGLALGYYLSVGALGLDAGVRGELGARIAAKVLARQFGAIGNQCAESVVARYLLAALACSRLARIRALMRFSLPA